MRTMTQTTLVVFLFDQISKVLVVHVLDLKSLGSISVLPPLLNFRMAWNRGVNFGLFSNGSDAARWILIVLALAISAWVAHWVIKERAGKYGQLSAGLLIGGAVGNAIDRVVYGAVADFLNMSCCGIDNPFAFNVADISIFFGAIGLMIFTGREKST